jgi:hypothetical protein
MRTLALLVLTLFAFASSPAAKQSDDFDHTHALWTRVLEVHVRPDGFDYAGLKKDLRTLDAYLATLKGVTPETLKGWTREQRFAFWINVYNAHVVNLVVKSYPLQSIQDLGGLMTTVWNREIIPLAKLHPEGENDKLSLDDVEHKILRPRFEDARVHVAVNCASESCPPLRAEAFVAERLDEQLDDQARKWLANEALNRYDRTGTRVVVSKLFEWFARDFMRDAKTVQAWMARYAPAEHQRWIASAKKLKFDFLEYSWKLNDASRQN